MWTLLCHTYIFLYFVCIILCNIFILTLFCHTYIGCQFVSILVRFLFHHQGFSHMLSFLSSLYLGENFQRQFYWKVAPEDLTRVISRWIRVKVSLKYVYCNIWNVHTRNKSEKYFKKRENQNCKDRSHIWPFGSQTRLIT